MSKNLSCLSYRNRNSPGSSGKPFFRASVEAGSNSFYDFTKKENEDKKIHVCCGTVCMVSGTQVHVHDKLKEHFTDDETGKVCCLGRCHENSSFMYNNRNYSGEDIGKIAEIIAGDIGSPIDIYHVNVLARETMLTPHSLDIPGMYQLAAAYTGKSHELIAEIKASQLRGRGGAGFPISVKLESFSSAVDTDKYIICNADEGDPGAFSDRYLLENQSHLVLFGMLVCGLANNASEGILYIRCEYPEAIEKTLAAIDELNKYSSFPFRIVKGKGAYVCGEETSLINSIEGQRPEVRVRPPYPTIEGLYGRPTFLSNVETFANMYWILKHGGDQYATYGSDKSRGNKLVCLDSCFNKPGVYEVEFGTPLTRIFSEAGGGFRIPIKALQIGGPLGGVVPLNSIGSMTLDFESLQEQGYLMGHAGIVGIPEDFSMIRYILHLLEFARDESCGKCYPCRIGSQRADELVRNAIENNEKICFELLEDILWTMEKGSLCALGGGLPLPVNNILSYFNDELSRYF
jgi:NADH-quinone oxidoreductase subunit F